MKNCRLIFTMILLLVVAGLPSVLSAQELNCKVQINTNQIPGTDKGVYENLKNVVQEFMNTQQWSNLDLKKQEKIDCSLTFVLKTREGNTHTCDLQIQSSRPVYGSTYTTTLLNTRENFSFEFQENQTLTYNATSINDNLTATLAFWSYVILGLDFDSFSNLGGTPFFDRAKDISSMAQGSLGENWKPQEETNHWGWINALTDEGQNAMRVLSYKYHRLGLDVMFEKPDEGRNQITSALAALKVTKQAKPRSPLLSNFSNSKIDELINICSKSNPSEKQVVYDLLVDIYPSMASRLEGIKTNK